MTASPSDRYPVLNVSPEDLLPSPQEPKGRMETNTALNDLKSSIQAIGLKYPPLVVRAHEGRGYMLVDGHRRWVAIQALGWQTMPVLVTQGDPKTLFPSVAGTTKAVSASDWLDVYLKGGDVGSKPTKTCIIRMEQEAGREFLVRLQQSGMRPSLWNVAHRVMAYADLPKERTKDVLEWLLAGKLARAVGAWITGKHPVHILKEALDKGVAPDEIRQQQLWSTKTESSAGLELQASH